MEDIEPVNLILMGNTKQSNDKNIEAIFDLKGSMVNREVRNAEKLKNTATLKDKNLLALCKKQLLLRFKPTDVEKVLFIIEKDIEFLSHFQIMDYSLLFAIERNPDHRDSQASRSKTEAEEDIDMDVLDS
jgi:hypothetical protein